MSENEMLKTPSSIEIRKYLQDKVRLDLLGPAGGEYEEIDERNVRGRYILGLLAPKGQTFLPDQQDELQAAGSDEGEDGKADNIAPQMASMLPSSIGLTFSVEAMTSEIQIQAGWGTYRRVRSDTLVNDKGEPQLVWKRFPVEATSPAITLKEGRLGPWYPKEDNEDVYVRGLCRKRDDCWTITLFLVNAQKEPAIRKDEAWLFQPELKVEAADGAAIFIKRQLPEALNNQHPEDKSMQMLYRRSVEFAVGHGVAIHAQVSEENWERATAVRTMILPTFEVERMESPTAVDIPLLEKAVLDMKALSELQMGQFSTALRLITAAYEEWIERQEKRAQHLSDLQSYQETADSNLENCRQALARIEAGIALLDEDEKAAKAFQFANQAMYLQRIRTIFSSQVRQGKAPGIKIIDQPGNRSWRPFQLAFVLLNLPALVDPTHAERSDATAALTDLLWFPTGGGKTEAYLGVAAFAMAIRRLQGNLGGLESHAGVTVLMRYTLRLLTLQQFQRATTLIAAMEVIRRDNEEQWGAEPFRIGLWVGQRSTPNWTKYADEAIKQDHGQWLGGAFGRGTPHQLTNCPWCGKRIDPGKNIRVELKEVGRGRTFQYCSDRLGNCPFSFKQSPNEGIPIVVVDEEIYRRLPALVIATVDKFAQMPWKGETQMLFGRVNGYCPRHGFRSPEVDDSDSHPRKRPFPAVKTQPAGPLRPPDLIIQDELHLISGPLGTLMGLYETAVDQLCSWELNGTTVRPKVIASTATIRRARSQVNNLFLREVKIFPPSAVDAEDNFFSKKRPSSSDSPGRLYVGVCSPGTRMRTILLRVYTAYMAAAQDLLEQYGEAADPYMTMVGYFNSMRELAGMRRVVDDSLRTRLMRMDERGLTKRYVNPYNVEELTSRKGATDIPKILDRLEQRFGIDAPVMKGNKRDFSKQPLDVVLATNMISVGVDVSRLGLMVVASQPKATAEYIQATSRVGRAFPGIVCTVYNWARPRDLSHYERFEHYHATFYQQVEALSVTPFSARALDRGLSGVLVSYVRLLGEVFNANEAAGQLDRQHQFVETAVEEISHRAGLISGSNEKEEFVASMLKKRLDEWLTRTETSGGARLAYTPTKDGRTLGLLKKPTEEDWHWFTCLNSLRDVEPSVNLILQDQGMDHEPGRASTRDEEAV